MLILTIGGTLGQDPELRATGSGNMVATFRVAVNGYDFSKKEKITTWVRVTMWGDRGEKIARMLAKGDKVMATGTGRLNEYTTKDGEKRTTLELNASDIAPMGGKPRDESGGAGKAQKHERNHGRAPAPQQPGFSEFPEDDIPF